MSDSQLSKAAILEGILEPLLEDFRYWFERSLQLLEGERLEFMTASEQSDLVRRVREALSDVNASVSLFQATGKQVGVDVRAMMPWHNLLMECQSVGMRYRQRQQKT